MAWRTSGGSGIGASTGGGGTRGKGKLVVGGIVTLFVLSAFLSGGLGGGLIAVGLLVLAAGAWALLRGRLHGLGIASRRAAAGVAAAGFLVTGIGGSLAPAADAEPLPEQQAAVATTTAPAPTTSQPTSTRPVQAPATTTAAPTTPTPTTTPALPPAPVMSMTCPSFASGASPVFGRQISATGPYSVTITYGDGDSYTGDDQHLGAVFTHSYPSAGTFAVQAVLTDIAGQTATAGCSYTWTAPRPAPAPAPAPAPVPAPTVGSTGGGSSAGGGGAEPYYKNCDAVRAAGAAPIYPGDPGFQPKFDANDDGVGCEN
jgi:hypothetical protein